MTFPLALLAALLGGWISLSYEILWFRVYSFTSGGSPAAFGLLLGYYLAGLALGAYFSRMLCRDSRAAADRRKLRRLAVVVFVANLVGYAVIPTLAASIAVVSWGTLLLLVTLSAALFGALFPIISHLGVAPDDEAGARMSYLYLANIAGSALGTLVTGFVLLDVMTTSEAALALVLAGQLLVLLLLGLVEQRAAARAASAGAVLVTTIALVLGHQAAFDRLYERLLFKEQDTGDRFADLVENRQGVIAVTSQRRVYGGGAYDGVISTDLVDDHNFIVRAFAVVALHPRPRNVLMIGLSTGAWAQVLANSPDVERLTVVEINPGYLGLVEKYPEVRSLLHNPKVRIVIDDGRRWLVHHRDRRFDVIVQNTTEHWRAHTTNLLSAEYLALVRTHLERGGIFHYNTTDSQDAFKTAFTVFPFGLRFANFATVGDSPVHLDAARWRAVLERYRIDGRPVFDGGQARDVARLDSLVALADQVDAAPGFVSIESRAHLLSRLGAASVITDDNMLPEWRTLLVRH